MKVLFFSLSVNASIILTTTLHALHSRVNKQVTTANSCLINPGSDLELPRLGFLDNADGSGPR